MILKSFSMILLLVIVGYVQAEYTELYNHPGVAEKLIQNKSEAVNTTVKYSDINMFMDFRNNLHKMVDSVDWNAEAKSWADTGLIALNKPLTGLAVATSEVSIHTEYKGWVKELKVKVTGKLITAYKDAHLNIISKLKEKLLRKVHEYQKTSTSTQSATLPMNVIKPTTPLHYTT